MAPVAERLVGRTGEIGSIDAALVELGQGRPRCLELVGEPGIGKTRLLAELAARADGLGCLVLSGRAAEMERDLPFWVFVDALDEYVEGLDPLRLQTLDEDVRAELATVLPSLSALATGRQVALQHERYRSHRAVRELLELLASTQPLILVLDDLHWADDASLELLGALLRRVPAGAVLMALAVRPRQVPERLSSALERAHRDGILTRLELKPLSPREADELLGEAIGGADTTVIYEDSGGNPFYLEQLARTIDRPTAATAGPGILLEGMRVPPTVAAALAEELALLSAATRRVLEGAAVAGDPFDPELAAAAAGTPEPAALDALDELLRLDLVRPTEVPRRFRFRHPLVRRTVYESAPGGWLLGAHERSADALAARGASASARAHHVERAARQGDAAAVAVLREAGEAAARRAPSSAERWFGAAVRLLPEGAPAQERVELLLGRSEALAAIGQFADSRATLIESIAIVPPEAEALRVRLTAACAGVERLLGRYAEAHARLETALADIRETESPEAVALMIELAADNMHRADFVAMADWATRALAAAAPLDDRPLTSAALAVSSLGAALAGTAVQAQGYGEAAALLLDEMSEEEIARRLDALVHLAAAEMYLDHFAAAGGYAERALRIGRATGQGEFFPLLFPMLGTSLWIQGRLAESAEVFDGAVEGARLLENAEGLAWNLLNRSLAALVAGDIDTALATAQESADRARDLDEGVVSAHAAWALAAALLETGEAGRAADLLVASAGGEELRFLPGSWRGVGLELLTRCLLAAGRRPEAERVAKEAAVCADAVGLPMPRAMAHLAAAALDLDAGRPERAAERALAAGAMLEEVGHDVYAARSRMLAGRALAQAGHEDAAAAELERAAADYESFGATRYRDEAERDLRRLGRRIHRRTRPGTTDGVGVELLTERELQVARLLVDRRTNSEIAAALFLSRKTIEAHIRSMFVKLGVSSRADVARAIERADQEAGSP